MKRKTFWLDKEDEDALLEIVKRYNCESDAQAVRLALRHLAESVVKDVVLPPTPKRARRSPKKVAEE